MKNKRIGKGDNCLIQKKNWIFLIIFFILVMGDVATARNNDMIQRKLLIRYPTSSPQISEERINQLGITIPQKRRYMSRIEFQRLYGIYQQDLKTLQSFLSDHKIDILEIDGAKRLITVSTREEIFKAAFGALTGKVNAKFGEIADIVQYIFTGSENSALSTVFTEVDSTTRDKKEEKIPPNLQTIAYTPPEWAEIYSFPKEYDGKGETIGIIAFGMGFDMAVLEAYFKFLKIPVPDIKTVLVGGFKPSDGASDFEVTMDIEVAGAMAPGAKIVVYLANNNPLGWYEALSAAIHDKTHQPSVISLSFAFAENKKLTEFMKTFNQLFMEAALLGVTICGAAGDLGAGAGVDDCLAHAYFPASSPFILACGGTLLLTYQNKKERYMEVTWDNRMLGQMVTGGGISEVFKLPEWQYPALVPPSANFSWQGPVIPGRNNCCGGNGRGFPDVSANADHVFTGYLISLKQENGIAVPFLNGGGTSAVAPLWAALLARVNQGLGVKVGFITPLLYKLQLIEKADVFFDVTIGNNGAYHARSGWDPVTGLGSPRGILLFNALKKMGNQRQ